jgi:hypothetical protein
MESVARNIHAGTGGPARARRRVAFSFVEVLFAVMILGIGFIMLAGIFPVAISQTQTTGEETNAANIARSAVALLDRLPGTALLMTPDGRVRRFGVNPYGPLTPPAPPFDGDANDNGAADDLELWERVKGSLILPEDPRYAWVPLYRRWSRPNALPPPVSLPNDFAEVTILVMRVRNKAQYGYDDLVITGQNAPLMPRQVTVQLEEGYGAGDILIINETHTLAPGALVMIAAGADRHGRQAAGRMYRIGNAVTDGARNRYFLAPSNDMLALPGQDGRLGPAPANGTDDVTEETTGSGLPAWIIGEGVDPATGANFGGAQDVAVYTSLIKLNP